jgi:hypothetical protein
MRAKEPRVDLRERRPARLVEPEVELRDVTAGLEDLGVVVHPAAPGRPEGAEIGFARR